MSTPHPIDTAVRVEGDAQVSPAPGPDWVRERAALRSLVRRALRAEIDGTWIDEAMRLVGPGGKLEQAIADAIAAGQGPGGGA